MRRSQPAALAVVVCAVMGAAGCDGEEQPPSGAEAQLAQRVERIAAAAQEDGPVLTLSSPSLTFVTVQPGG